MDKDPGPLNVLQKLISQPMPFMCSLNQSRYICNHKGSKIVHLYDSKVRHQGCKWIVGNFRLCRADSRDKGRFAYIGKSDQANISDQLQAKR